MLLPLQPPSPEHSDHEPDELEEEDDEEPEQKTAYQKLLSTLSQPTINDQSEEESSDEEEELLDERGLSYYLDMVGCIGQTIAVNWILMCFIVIGDSDGVDDDREEGDADDGGEEEPEDADEAVTEAGEGEGGEKEEVGVEEFVDKEYESQFCLETNFMDEEGQEDSDSTSEHKDNRGRERIKAQEPSWCVT